MSNNTFVTHAVLFGLVSVNILKSGCAFANENPNLPNENTQGEYYMFNSDFLVGTTKVDVARFAYGNQIDPGQYSMSLLVNRKPVGNADIVVSNATGKPRVCINKPLLVTLDIDLDKIPESAQQDNCADISELIPSANYTFNSQEFILDFAIPQAYLNRKYQGSISPDLWDDGVNAGFINYNGNYYQSTFDANDNNLTASNFFTTLSSGFNLGLWQFRNNSNYSSNRGEQGKWTTINSYVQRPVLALKSALVVGETNTSGRYFDSFSFRGVQLSSDDRMLADSQQGFAPIIRGTARTNARVEIRQGGVLLYNTTVAPGAFVIDDLYPTGYGGDLDVLVIETDGIEQRFSVPFSSVAQLLREDTQRYSLAVGELNNRIVKEKPIFVQGLYSRGISSQLTGYTGVQVAENYQSAVIGSAINTPIGALGLDVTGSHADLDQQGTKDGWSVKASHSKYIELSETLLSIAAYRYSNRSFYSFSDATLQRGKTDDSMMMEKGRFELSISQPIADYGSLFISGSSVSYWNENSRSTLYQAGYTLNLNTMSFGISASQTKNADDKSENSYLFSVSMPLGGADSYHNITSSVSTSSGSSQATLGLNGALGAESSLSYGLAGSYSSDNNNSVSGNLIKRYSQGQLSASASKGRSFEQYAVGTSGSIVIHSGGVTLGQYTSESLAIIEAKDAKGARVDNASSVYIDRFGYAVVPYLNAYRNNSIGIDPQGIPETTELLSSSKKVVPYSGAIVKIKFDTRSGRKAFIESNSQDGEPLPVGAVVSDEKGVNLGMVGLGGLIYVSGLNDKGVLNVVWGPDTDSQCRIPFNLKEASKSSDTAMPRLSLPCLPMNKELPE